MSQDAIDRREGRGGGRGGGGGGGGSGARTNKDLSDTLSAGPHFSRLLLVVKRGAERRKSHESHELGLLLELYHRAEKKKELGLLIMVSRGLAHKQTQ